MWKELHDWFIYWDFTAWYYINTQWVNDFFDAVMPYIRNQWTWSPLYLFLEQKTYTTNDVRTMANWLAFESSRLDLAKAAYNNVSDKSNYWKLEDVFTFSSTKDEFNKYVKSKKQ